MNYYLDIAQTVASRATCLRKKYGTVIVKNDEIISTGYTGAPRGRVNCIDLGVCRRKQNNMPSGLGYEFCRSVHSEQNAIISASRQEMLGATLYLVGYRTENHDYEEGAAPCLMCRKFIINAGIEKVIVREDSVKYKIFDVKKLIEEDEFLNGQLSY